MIRPVSIMVAAHKPYEFPSDSGYLPVQVGCALSGKKLLFAGDDGGDNISSLNKSFCELTGLYWLWKNVESEYYGLCHYRRYFKPNACGVSVVGKEVASSAELIKLLEDHQIILSAPRKYVVETVRSHYENAHNGSDLDTVESILHKKYPEYRSAFSRVMQRRTLSLYNMFVMRSDSFHSYCEWLFSILFNVQQQISYQEYGPYQGRVFGFLAERLLNVWVEHNIEPSRVKYLPVVNLEGEAVFKKAIGLLERKFKGVKQA